MAAGNTYVALATTEVGSADTVTFTLIPQTYTDLVVVLAIAGVSTVGQACGLQFNGDIDINYSFTLIHGAGSGTPNSYRTPNTNRAIIIGGYFGVPNGISTAIANVMNYANTTTFKTTIAKGNANNEVTATVSLWRNTAAINQIKILLSGTTFSTGTTVTLYGIAAA